MRCSTGPDRAVGVQHNLAIGMLGALALDARLRVIVLLSGVGDEGLSAGEIARQLGLQQNTLSGHLAKLSRAGIVTSERRKTSIIYRYDRTSLENLALFLTNI